jgi:hypothetical protein
MREIQFEGDLGLTGNDGTDLHTAKWPKNRLSVEMKLHSCREADYAAKWLAFYCR